MTQAKSYPVAIAWMITLLIIGVGMFILDDRLDAGIERQMHQIEQLRDLRSAATYKYEA